MSFSTGSNSAGSENPRPERRSCGGARRRPAGPKPRRRVPPTAVARRLAALKELIPPAGESGEGRDAGRIFEEAADYILLLRTRVAILKHLVDLYGSGSGSGRAEDDAGVS